MAYEITNQDFTRTGYTFEGYNTKADGTGTDYAVGASYIENANLMLYAKWKANFAVEVKSNPSKYYGAYVNYVPKNGCNVKWRVFYADSTRIYLIAEDYVENKYLTATGLTKPTGYIHNAENLNYCVYSSAGRQDLIDRLTNTSYYTEFKDNAGKASSVVGAATLEQLVASYNEVNPTNQIDILYCTAGQSTTGIASVGVDGYVLKFGNSGNYAYHITIPDEKKLYTTINQNVTKAYAMWLASYSAYSFDYMMTVSYYGYVDMNSSALNCMGLRPLVTLNSNVELVDPDGDGVYDLQ